MQLQRRSEGLHLHCIQQAGQALGLLRHEILAEWHPALPGLAMPGACLHTKLHWAAAN